MSQQEEDPFRYTRTLVVKPALSQMYDQVEVPRNGMQKQLTILRGPKARCGIEVTRGGEGEVGQCVWPKYSLSNRKYRVI